ncbi:hypothetical protein WI87_02515 [Burkholderia ubonensis]|nr:hypothetical protein WI87_02515 [Burkholderia ubonensis]KVP64028.1 hypothetical protein WJ93_27690 [Burkholderia ubonensis]KVT09216.1 hypothetical protein WK47_08615 [Burkholderia ubonensis]KVT16323.1 hypothetical protein WK46_25235 [Burkholderia ubonensis]KVT28394.1 hypothetical protein WK50_11405 [Burkholderia ubonensis]
MELHLDPTQLVGMNALPLRTHHRRRLHLHDRLTVFERAAEGYGFALRLDLDKEEALGAVEMSNLRSRLLFVARFCFSQSIFQAVRKVPMMVRSGQIVLNQPNRFDDGKFIPFTGFTVVLRMPHKFKPPPRIDAPYPSRAIKPPCT